MQFIMFRNYWDNDLACEVCGQTGCDFEARELVNGTQRLAPERHPIHKTCFRFIAERRGIAQDKIEKYVGAFGRQTTLNYEDYQPHDRPANDPLNNMRDWGMRWGTFSAASASYDFARDLAMQNAIKKLDEYIVGRFVQTDQNVPDEEPPRRIGGEREKLMYGILVGEKVKRVDNLIEWGEFMDKSDDRRIGFTVVGDVEVSTVFLGIDHGLASPQWFETMVFGGEHSGYQRRYETYAEARMGHEDTVKMVRGN